MSFMEIWNEAYNIFTDCERSESSCFNDMQRFLLDQVNAGNLSMSDKCYMVRDIIETAGL